MDTRTLQLSYPKHVSEEVDLLARALGAAAEVYLFVDYGGTLVSGSPATESGPSGALPDADVLAKLEQLGNEDSFSVFVLSGRSVDELERDLGVENIHLIGQQGFEIRMKYSEIEYPISPESLGGLIHHLELDAHRRLAEFDGVSIENRGFALTVRLHCRDSKEDRKASQAFIGLVSELDAQGKLEVLYGDCSVEARLAGWNKGDAVRHVLKGVGVEDALAVYIGDDVTDEVAFEAVNEWADSADPGDSWYVSGDPDDEEPPHALTILVAERPRPTTATLFVRGPNEVYEFLSSLAAIASALL